MKHIVKSFFLFLLVFIFFSCDPSHNLNFINSTDHNTKVKINLNKNVKHYRLNEISIGDSIVFNLKQNDTANIYFGIGTWSEKDLDELTKSINNIEIETKDIKTIYKTKKSMKNILENNVKGFWFNTLVEIKIE